MQIRNKLSLSFTITSSLLMLVIMTFIYILFADFSRDDFYTSLHTRTEVAAQLYLEADELSDSSLQKIRERFIISLPKERIRIYDSADQSSFIKNKNDDWGKHIIDEVRRQKYLEFKDGPFQTVGIYYEDNQGNFVILATAEDVAGARRKKNLLEILAILFGVQLLVQFVAGRWLAQRALYPIQMVNAQVQKITATDLHLRVAAENTKDELGQLAANFNSLLQRLEQAFDLQKMFVSNASHELRTPVTNIVGEVEVAIQKDRTPKEYRSILQSVLVEAGRLNDIISNFLLLANSENLNTAELSEPVRLDELMWEIKDTLPHAQGQRLEIQLQLPDDERRLYLQTRKQLLLHALRNIIQNAFKFSESRPVIGTLQFNGDEIIISITDQGIGMSDEVLQNIFEPFYRAPHTGRQGYGIGLYIAKKIIELLGGSITVQSTPGSGSTFNIIFI